MIAISECPICRGPAEDAPVVHVYKGGTYGGAPAEIPFDTRLVRCPSCDHVFSSPMPTWAELEPAYGSSSHYENQDARNDFDHASVDELIARSHDGARFNHLPVIPGGRYLDVGSGDGRNVAGMARLGMLAEGVEPRESAAEYCRAAGLKIRTGTLEEAAFPGDSFDCLSLNHVLEHVHEPIGLLRECRRVLKPGGTLFVGVPNYRAMLRGLVGWSWIGLDPPRHLHQFQADSLRDLLARAGFSVESIETESLVPFVELELCAWARRNAKIPRRLTLKTAVFRPLAIWISRRGNATGRGEALAALAVK